MTSIVIKPAEGRRLRDESGTLIEDEISVDASAYWSRRLADGDAIEVKSAAPAPVRATVKEG